MMTLYRSELSPQQQQPQQQQGGPLPMQRPPVPQQQAQPPLGTANKPVQEEDMLGNMKMSVANKFSALGDNRFTSRMQERVGQFAQDIRAQIDSGSITDEEGKQILASAIGDEFKTVTGWMNGKKSPQNYMETKDPAATKKYLQENRQAFEEARDLKASISERETILRDVYDKKDPRYQKSVQDLMQMKQRYSQMHEALRNGILTGEAYDGDKAMREQRGEEVV